MDFTEYQAQARNLAVYPGQGSNDGFLYTVLGLSGEVGEVTNKVKKLMRDGVTPETQDALIAKLGDTLWFLSAVCTELDIALDGVAEMNLDKLNKRFEAGTLRNEGDDR